MLANALKTKYVPKAARKKFIITEKPLFSIARLDPSRNPVPVVVPNPNKVSRCHVSLPFCFNSLFAIQNISFRFF
jgi:hypothetical protein